MRAAAGRKRNPPMEMEELIMHLVAIIMGGWYTQRGRHGSMKHETQTMCTHSHTCPALQFKSSDLFTRRRGGCCVCMVLLLFVCLLAVEVNFFLTALVFGERVSIIQKAHRCLTRIWTLLAEVFKRIKGQCIGLDAIRFESIWTCLS